jgi:signal transduction histidine kinase
MLRQVISGSQAVATQKGLYLWVDCPAELHILTDRVKLERILCNLLNNAVKFTDQGGVRVVAESASGALEIHVVDTGIGLAPAQQARLFQEFYQVENHARDRKKGFGLGLAISRRLARQLGGDVEVESAQGSGSRFSVLLPGVVVLAGTGASSGAQPSASAIPAGARAISTGE